MPQEACGVQVREAALASHAGVRSQRVEIKAEKGSWGEEREESLSFLEIFGFCCSLESADVDDSFASCKRQAERCSGVFQGAREALPNEV